jgi:hypothetical protein
MGLINRTVDISMPRYIKKKIHEYGHLISNWTQKCPYSPEPKKFGSEAQAPLPPNDRPKLFDAKGIKRIQKIMGSILYYAQAVDRTVLMALSSITVKQTKTTEKTMDRCRHLLDYLATNEMAKIRFHASVMILNIHSDASYLSETRACSHGLDDKRQ